jgi:peptidoglycan/xylan/chitin deacetylase (PgdA/CDA1 family)
MSFWPESAQGAISLTFDDGLPSHLKVAVPNLDQRELRATFYLNPNGPEKSIWRSTWCRKLNPWLQVWRAGHEIGNHSLNHPCSFNIPVGWARNLLDMNLDELRTDLVTAQQRLQAVFPQDASSFAYPCYETSVGRGRGRVSYIPLVAEMFVAGRSGGELRAELANDPYDCNLHCLSSWAVERQRGDFMIRLVEQAVSQGRWGIFTFHGIQEGRLPVRIADFIELLDYLKRQNEGIWIAPLAEVASYIAERVVFNS